MNAIRRWIRRAIIHRYFPEVWYAIENWLSARGGEHMLEIGCGRGLFTAAIAKDGWSLTAVDPSRLSVDRAQRRVDDAGLHVQFKTAKPEALPLPAEFFDAVSVINYLEFSPQPQLVLNEAMRVLKPGGKGVIVVFRSASFWALPWVAASLRKDNPQRPYRCLPFDELRRLIIQSGFSIEKYTFRARYLPLQPGRGVIPWPFAGAIIASVKRPMPGEQQVKNPPKLGGLFHK